MLFDVESVRIRTSGMIINRDRYNLVLIEISLTSGLH